MSYTIRQDTREYVTMKKNHRKIAKRFMAFLNWPGLNNKVNFLINCISIQDKKLEQIVKEF